MKLALMTFPALGDYLSDRKSIILPIGSTEQHSTVGLLGTDHLIAEEIALQVGENTGTPVAPTQAFGMSNHHLAFQGTISLNPTTLIAVVKDVLESLYRHGFRKFYFVNGHGGNNSSCEAAFSEFTRDHNCYTKIVSWWTLPGVQELSISLFGDLEGHHATPSEISVTQHFYSKHFEESHHIYKIDHPKYSWPLSPTDFRKHFPDGRMSSDPSLASPEHGKIIFQKAVEEIQADFQEFDALI